MKIKDAKGREWNFKLNFKILCRIEDEVGWAVLDDPTKMPSSIRKWGEIAGIVLEDQIKERGLEPDDFAEGFCGEQFQGLIDAMLTELAVFFEAPKPGMAALLRKALVSQKEVTAHIVQALEDQYDKACSVLLEQLELSHGPSQPGS